MDFEYSDEQKLLSETLRKFLSTGYSFDARAKSMAGASGYDLRQVALRAKKSGDGFVLDGEKCMVLHGGAADLLVVSARTAGGERDEQGISLFLVERGAPGVSVIEYRTLDNLRVADIT